MNNPFNFFDKSKSEPKSTPAERRASYVEERVRALACAAAALGYLRQLGEYRNGVQARERVEELVQGLTADVERVGQMEPAAFVAWYGAGCPEE